ncbi:hypothetical protein DPEC_G00075900 [Dallia pectoralis]|uniref:Uncharacterized protein n=1 Tax=Dallia pectoralis TaxID=75939 RepID=A0ACC2H3N9_DALPE|nr:hypothetical protein DPEC_G00075900 [Dallia pectoralis]
MSCLSLQRSLYAVLMQASGRSILYVGSFYVKWRNPSQTVKFRLGRQDSTCSHLPGLQTTHRCTLKPDLNICSVREVTCWMPRNFLQLNSQDTADHQRLPHLSCHRQDHTIPSEKVTTYMELQLGPL